MGQRMSESNYWDGFYKGQQKVNSELLPSQFAVFFLNEIGSDKLNIIDIGCGNGRDSFMFSKFNHNVIGIDGSTEAINYCNSKKVNGAQFVISSIDDFNLIEKVKSYINGNRTVIYSRFFLHAINESSQNSFLKISRELLEKGELLFIEFRTNKDKFQKKMTQDHYRRFINPIDFIETAIGFSFKVRYFVEGYGLAKYKDDDAHVARFILEAV